MEAEFVACRCFGATENEEYDEPFADKMKRLVADLEAQVAESAKLEKDIRKNMKGLGFGE